MPSDIIKDFSVSEGDKIKLSGNMVDTYSAGFVDDFGYQADNSLKTVAHFTGSGQILADTEENIRAADVSAKLWYEQDAGVGQIAYATDTGKIIYDEDGNFSSDTITFITLDGAPELTAASFTFA